MEAWRSYGHEHTSADASEGRSQSRRDFGPKVVALALMLASALATPEGLVGEVNKTSPLRRAPDVNTNMSVRTDHRSETDERALSLQIPRSESSQTRSETLQIEIYPGATLRHGQTIERGEMTGFLAD